ncbi:MAG TPA: PA domain-containing protein, partial [Gemmatimonadales bacterium]
MKTLLLVLMPVMLQAQRPGFSPAASARQDSVERALLAVPDTQSARVMTHDLARVPHMAGTPAQAATRDYVVDKMKGWGLETWTKAYEVYLPHPDTTGAWLIAGPRAKPVALDLREPAIPGDSTSRGPQVMPFNGSTGIGDVTGDVVYVGYGLIEDYKTLDSLGVSVKGKIAIARYGRSFRGIKAREAEKHGALALMLYSDPADDGYDRGDIYPRGPMRPWGGIQRGSVENMDGDPSTPDRPSIAGAVRVPEDSLAVPHIPVIPMSYGNARQFLEALGGASVPQAWQGGLAFRYHVGAGPVRARIKVRAERGAKAMHTIWDTFGMIRGTTYPDQWVIVGGHRDAWGPGAAD